MELQLIKTESEYQRTLKKIDELINCEENSEQEEKLALLSLLVWDYEEKHYPIGRLSPVKAIKTRMDELELKPKDLIAIIGDINICTFIYQKLCQYCISIINRIM